MENLEEKKEHKELRQRFNRETNKLALFHKIDYIYWLEQQVVNNGETVKREQKCLGCGRVDDVMSAGYCSTCDIKA